MSPEIGRNRLPIQGHEEKRFGIKVISKTTLETGGDQVYGLAQHLAEDGGHLGSDEVKS